MRFESLKIDRDEVEILVNEDELSRNEGHIESIIEEFSDPKEGYETSINYEMHPEKADFLVKIRFKKSDLSPYRK